MCKCLKCNDISNKSINSLINKFPNIYRSCNNDNEKAFIPMNTWIILIDLMKMHYLQKKNFTVT